MWEHVDVVVVGDEERGDTIAYGDVQKGVQVRVEAGGGGVGSGSSAMGEQNDWRCRGW